MRLYKSNGYVVLIGIVFLFLGSASILYSIKNFGNYYKKISTYNQTEGTIIDVYKQRQYVKDYNMEELTICEFRYMIEDELYVNSNIINKNQFKVGDKTTIFYMDNEPQEGLIMPDNLSLYGILGVLGVIMFGSGVGITLIGLSAKEVIVFQQNNLEIDMDVINNPEWNNKLKEIRLREISNNQRVFSSFQQNNDESLNVSKIENDFFDNVSFQKEIENDYYNDFC